MSDKKTILIIDDDKMFCQVVRTYLDTVGFNTITSNSGNNVIEMVMENSCDLVVLDLYMVRETGIDTLIELQKHIPDIPVIIMTGYASNELEQTARNLGACEFVKKPFSMAGLKEKIDALLGTA